MLGPYKLAIDTHSTVYDLLKPYADEEFWEFSTFNIESVSVCVIGRQQFTTNLNRIQNYNGACCLVFDNAAEGSQTLHQQLSALNLARHIKIISGGELDPLYNYLRHDHFFNVILGYNYNVQQMTRLDEIYNKKTKPYKFLFLNGRARPHRKYLWQQFYLKKLLDAALWTMLEGNSITQLPKQYEVEQYQHRRIATVSGQLIKHEMFDNTWGEIYARADPYIDTYFSVVTETVVDYPHSFRTEKIAKPLLLGHPWIAAANRGFYRDIRSLGFRTFENVIDEGFDLIDNTQDRLNRIVEVVDDLCRQDLASFLDSCYNVCKYNQQHLQEYRIYLRKKFPSRFLKYIHERS